MEQKQSPLIPTAEQRNAVLSSTALTLYAEKLDLESKYRAAIEYAAQLEKEKEKISKEFETFKEDHRIKIDTHEKERKIKNQKPKGEKQK
jgi:hypothetical protein